MVLELVSKNTCRKNLAEKKDLYESVLKVKEYYLYDPDGQYLQPHLQGYRLVDGIYLPIQPTLDNRLPSFVLGLELGIRDGELRLYDPNFNQPNQPVVCVSWDDAVAYAQWAGKRCTNEFTECSWFPLCERY